MGYRRALFEIRNTLREAGYRESKEYEDAVTCGYVLMLQEPFAYIWFEHGKDVSDSCRDTALVGLKRCLEVRTIATTSVQFLGRDALQIDMRKL